MISKDKDLLLQATECLRHMIPLDILEEWWENPNHVMIAEGDNVGMATFEYPGLYTCHWYFQSARGREAINLARRMIGELFDKHGAMALRGVIRAELRASKWGCRQVGFKSYGTFRRAGGEETELFIITKDEYKEQMNG